MTGKLDQDALDLKDLHRKVKQDDWMASVVDVQNWMYCMAWETEQVADDMLKLVDWMAWAAD